MAGMGIGFLAFLAVAGVLIGAVNFLLPSFFLFPDLL
jgi:hypothetical protein